MLEVSAPMFDSTSPIPFERDDLELLTLEEVSQQLRTSVAFVRLCLAAGCPTRRGRLSAAELLHWLFDNYPSVRSLCGLKPLAETLGVPPEAQLRLNMANALFTLLDYSESRATDLRVKIEIRKVWHVVERSIERA